MDDEAEAERSAALVARARSCPSAFFAVREEPRGRFRLEIAGPLLPAWCGNLFAECAGAGLSIERGSARRAAPGRWAGDFELVPGDPAARVRGFDFVRMARRRPQGWSRPDFVRIDRFAIHPSGEACAVRVDVEGADRVGFLAWWIETFACFGLHPARLLARTRAGRVRDSFWLTGVGGTAPSEDGLAALREALERQRRGDG